MTFDEWVNKYKGKGIDYDKYAGVQCVDLVKHFVKNVLELTPQSVGNAIDYYKKRYTEPYLTDNFDWIDNTPKFVPQKGDIGVFKTNSRLGHIVVCNGVGDTSSFQAYDENHNDTHAPMTLRIFAYSGKRTLLGVLRPKDQRKVLGIATGWKADSNGWYYVNEDGNYAKSQWLYVDGDWYYMGDNGYCLTSQWFKYKNDWYYFNATGRMDKSKWVMDSQDWCYVDREGKMVTNAWCEDSQGWCYVKNDGHLLRDGYAWDSVGKHYLDDTGHMEW